MIVQEIEVTSRQSLYLCQRILHPLGVEPAASLKESVLVAEVAMLGAAACDHYGIRYQVTGTLDEVAPDCRNTLQSAACRRRVNSFRFAGTKVLKKFREGLLSGAEEDGVSVHHSLIGERRNMQAAQANKSSLATVTV